MTNWQAGDVPANGIRVHYTRTGGDRPPVVLAHGFSDDGLCWTPVAARLAAHYDVIMVDARGHGHSDAPPTGYDSADHAADLAGVITALGLRRPAVLGHSMGAASALTLAGQAPELVRAILLEDPPPLWNRPPVPPTAADQRPDPTARFSRLIALQAQSRDEIIAGQRTAEPGWAEAELGPWADAKLRVHRNVLTGPAVTVQDWPASLSDALNHGRCGPRSTCVRRRCCRAPGNRAPAGSGTYRRCRP